MELEIHVLPFCVVSEDVLERVKCISRYFYAPRGFGWQFGKQKTSAQQAALEIEEITDN